MIKPIHEELPMFTMSDLYCTCFWVKEQYKKYLAYKDNKLEDIKENEKKEFETLNLLEQLGYPIEKAGTFFYRDMILKIVEYLENIEELVGFKKYHKLLDELADHYSHFYFDLARNELDVGIKTFHEVLENQISIVDHSNANAEKFNEVFGTKEVNNLGYEEKTFVISSYLYLNKRIKREKIKVK